MKSHQSISSSEYFPIAAVSFILVLLISFGMWVLSNPSPVCFEAHISNPQKVSESLFNTALVQIFYYFLSLCSNSQLFAKVLSCTEFAFMFSFKWQFFCFKTCRTIQLWKVHLNVFNWLPVLELSRNNWALTNSVYTLPGINKL